MEKTSWRNSYLDKIFLLSLVYTSSYLHFERSKRDVQVFLVAQEVNIGICWCYLENLFFCTVCKSMLLLWGGFRGVCRGCAPSLFFTIICFFLQSLWRTKTVLFKVELIINNAPLTYVYPNTIKTCLTPNHSLFDRQLLYYSNTTSTVVRNLIVISSTTDKINRSNHFWDRWRHEYVVNLCEKQPTSKPNVNSQKIILC